MDFINVMSGSRQEQEVSKFWALREQAQDFLPDLSGLSMFGLSWQSASIISLLGGDVMLAQDEYEPWCVVQAEQALSEARRVAKALDNSYFRDAKQASPRGYHGRGSVSHRSRRVDANN
jgi:hypothetical protein